MPAALRATRMQSSSAQVVRVRRVLLDIAVRSRSLAVFRKAIAAVVW